MARTFRTTTDQRDGQHFWDPQTHYYRKEAGWVRKMTNRKARRGAAAFIHHADPEATLDPRPVSTGGWLTH